MKNVKMLFCIAASMMFCMIFSGCGKDTGSVSELKQDKPADSALWKTQGFAVPEDAEKDGKLNIREYLLWEHKEVFDAGAGEERYLIDSGFCGGLIWWLNEVTGGDKQKEWVLEIYEAVTGECTVKSFSDEELGVKNGDGALRGMDLIDRDHYVFQWVEEEYDNEGFTVYRASDRMIYTDLAGEIHAVDLWPVYLEKGLADGTGSARLQEGNCDGKGNTYVLASLKEKQGYGSVHFFDRDGNMILEYRGEQFETVQPPLRTQEGELIFPVWDNNSRQIEYFWADTEGGRMCSLAVEKASSLNIYQLYGMQGNDIYYNKANREIIRWNIETGERIKILSLPENGLVSGYTYELELGMVFGQEEYPVLCLIDRYNKKDWLAPLTNQEIKGREGIRIVDTVEKNGLQNMVEEGVTLAAALNRKVSYLYEQNVADEYRTRLFADISSGKGPEVMYVSLEDMRILAEKGALLNLEDLLPETLLEEVLPGVLEFGTIDGRLMGMPVNVQASFVMVSRDTWPEDRWTLEDVICLMENGELEGGIYAVYADLWEGYFAPPASVLQLIAYNLHDSFLIDWEKRECHFDDERFIRLLRATSTNLSEASVETDTLLKGGKRMVYSSLSPEVVSFFDVARERENGHYVGHPTNDDCGNYLYTGGVIVVNAATENIEAVRTYLEVLFGSRVQQRRYDDIGVCGIDSNRTYIDESTGKLMWWEEEVPVFTDHTTSIDRLNDFLRKCTAAPPTYPFLEDIIREELEIMYAENRDPKDTAEIINNRVQLYLDEGNEQP